MSRIDKNHFIQRLISQTGAAKAKQSGVSSQVSSRNSSTGGAGESYSLSFEQRIAAGLSAIDPNASNSTHKALEVYIGAALIDAFGAELMNDPAYAHLLSDVLEAIEQSPDYASFTEFVQTELKNVTR